MSHVDEGTLHALVDNELEAAERAVVEAHLAVCGDCARQFAEATAMARQVVTLLGALDAPVSPVLVLPAPAAARPAARDTSVIPIRTRMVTLRRVALAASVLLVAGVSYQVGQRGTAAPESVAFDAARRQPARAASVRAVPSVVEAAPDSYVAAPTPAVRSLQRGGPRAADAEMASGAAKGVRDASVDASVDVVAAEPAPRLVAAPVTPVVVPSTSQSAQKTTGTQVGAQRGAPGGAQSASQPVSQVVVTSASPAQSSTASQLASQRASQAPAEASSRAAADRAEQVEQRRASAGESASRERTANAAPQAAPAAQAALARTQPERDAPSRMSGAAAGPVPPKPTPLAGYVAVEDESVPAMTRRRYVSPSGVALELSIVRSATPVKDSISAAAFSEFVVSTANGRSTVRWHARGMDYVLNGPLAPDSLVKLATLLKP